MKYWLVVCVWTTLAALGCLGCDGTPAQSGDAANGGKDGAVSPDEGSGEAADASPDASSGDGASCADQSKELDSGSEFDTRVSSVCPDRMPENGAACTDVRLCCSYANGQVVENAACAGGEGGVVCKCKTTNTCGPTWDCLIGV